MKEINVKLEEFEILNQTYIVYIYEKEDFIKFYIGKKDYSIIKFIIGVNLQQMNMTIDEFIYQNLLTWIYIYTSDTIEEE